MRSSIFLVASCVALGCASPAAAQRSYIAPSFEAGATLTSNANFETGSEREADLIFNAAPGIRFRREGERLRLNGSASLNFIGYANGTQENRIQPQANILANLEAIDRFFYIDASFRANQEVLNPFLAQPDGTSTFNTYTYTQASIAPFLQGTFANDWRYLVRSDNSYTSTSQSDAALSNAYYGRHVAEVAREPTPLGTALRVQSDVTRFTDETDANQRLELALATVNYAFTPQLIVGLRGGYEWTNYTRDEQSGPVYGADLAWSPNPRTRLEGFWESRFFGPSYQAAFSNRQRLLATNLSFSRSVSTYPQEILNLPATGNVSGLLDAILLARFPDPIERAQQVQDLIARQALPQSLPGAVNIYSQSVNVLTSGSATFALIGVRNTLALNLFYLKTDTLDDPAIPATFIVFNDNVQKGAYLSFNHRLTPITSLNALAGRRETRGFDQSVDNVTDQNIMQVQVTRQLSARSSGFVGVRYQQQESSTAIIRDSNEAAVFIGFAHQR